MVLQSKLLKGIPPAVSCLIMPLFALIALAGAAYCYFAVWYFMNINYESLNLHARCELFLKNVQCDNDKPDDYDVRVMVRLIMNTGKR